MKTIKLIGLFLCLVSVLCAGSFTLKLGVPINAATLSQLRKTELVRLNAYRKAHGVGAVSSSEKLQAAAQKYAEHLCNTKSFGHSAQAKKGHYGENLFNTMAYPAIKYNFGTATQRWYDEIKDYNFATGKAITPGKVVGHFTAQIWKNVKKVGYGFCTTTKSHVISPSRSLRLAVLYVVANYSPTPNVQGQYTVNVLRPI